VRCASDAGLCATARYFGISFDNANQRSSASEERIAMLNNREVRGGNWPYAEKLVQAFLFRSCSMMTAEEHESQGGASGFAATAVEQDAHDAVGGAPFFEIVEGALNQLRRRRSSARLDVVACEDDLPIGPFIPKNRGEPRGTALRTVGGAFNRDYDRKRYIVSVASFHQVHDFGRFADGEL
jgi:hypothetical protein